MDGNLLGILIWSTGKIRLPCGRVRFAEASKRAKSWSWVLLRVV